MATVTSSHVGHPGGFPCLLLQIMQRPVTKQQLGAAGRRDNGDRAGHKQRGPSLPALPWHCWLGAGQGTWLLQPSPGGSSPSRSIAKQLFCPERCLRFFHASQAIFLETPAPESSGYVKMCLHLKQKRVSQPCDPRGKFVTTCGLGCLEWPSLLGSTCSSKGPSAPGSLEPAWF